MSGSVGSKNLLRSSPILSPLKRSLHQELLQEFSHSLTIRSPPDKAPDALKPRTIISLPGLVDDYYLNLLDWSPEGEIAVGLGSTLQLWRYPTDASTATGAVKIKNENICAVKWAEGGKALLGLGQGRVIYLDVERAESISNCQIHGKRIGSIAYHSGAGIFTTGSKDCSLKYLDPRVPALLIHTTCRAHEQEICGLQWEARLGYLASGGNDNELLVWDLRRLGASALMRCQGHEAAVKAIAWSPHRRGVLASGGGTADRTIRLWRIGADTGDDNTDNEQNTAPTCFSTQRTSSQVCGMTWSPISEQLISAHGFSEHQCLRWAYRHGQEKDPLVVTGVMKGHSQRVLGLGVAPKGEAVATASPDGTMCLWFVFTNERPHRTVVPLGSDWANCPVLQR